VTAAKRIVRGIVSATRNEKRGDRPGEKTLEGKLFSISGRVQGVGFRYFAQRAAVSLGITGYAKNLDDGRVEVYAVGNPAQLSELAGLLRKGPPYSEVRGVTEQQAPIQKRASFQVEPG
jgi:acylphosphatase